MDLPRQEQPTRDRTHDIARRAVGELVQLNAPEGDGVLVRLRSSNSLRGAVDLLVTELVIAARDEGATWAEIGESLGVSTQAAHQKYRHLAAVAAVSGVSTN
jgi:hypothetical protein